MMKNPTCSSASRIRAATGSRAPGAPAKHGPKSITGMVSAAPTLRLSWADTVTGFPPPDVHRCHCLVYNHPPPRSRPLDDRIMKQRLLVPDRDDEAVQSTGAASRILRRLIPDLEGGTYAHDDAVGGLR